MSEVYTTLQSPDGKFAIEISLTPPSELKDPMTVYVFENGQLKQIDTMYNGVDISPDYRPIERVKRDCIGAVATSLIDINAIKLILVRFNNNPPPEVYVTLLKIPEVKVEYSNDGQVNQSFN